MTRALAALPPQSIVVTALGITQILAWGATFYLPGVLAQSIATDTGWPLDFVVGGLSAGLLVAGVVSPHVGRAIAASGGRPVLAFGAIMLALGLGMVGMAPSLPWYLAGWLVIGVGMGAGLYDAAFATLGVAYGAAARRAITFVTLFGGFSSTVCWPLSAVLDAHLGWRGTCFAYAVIQLAIALPIHLLVLPARARGDLVALAGSPDRGRLRPGEWPVFALVTAVLTISAAILSLMSVHLITLLQQRGIGLAAAVGLGAIVGPAQVGARFIEMVGGRHYHPIWTMAASAVLVTLGVTLLLTAFSMVPVALVLYGAGNGIGSIARGTVPLALFGGARYASISGRIALPTLLAMAVAPLAGALALQAGGGRLVFGLVLGLGLINVGLVAALWQVARRSLLPKS